MTPSCILFSGKQRPLKETDFGVNLLNCHNEITHENNRGTRKKHRNALRHGQIQKSQHKSIYKNVKSQSALYAFQSSIQCAKN